MSGNCSRKFWNGKESKFRKTKLANLRVSGIRSRPSSSRFFEGKEKKFGTKKESFIVLFNENRCLGRDIIQIKISVLFYAVFGKISGVGQ